MGLWLLIVAIASAKAVDRRAGVGCLRVIGAEILRCAGIRAAVGRWGLLAATCIPGEMGIVLEVALRAP